MTVLTPFPSPKERGESGYLLSFLSAFLESFLSVSSCQRCLTISRKRRRAAFRCAISSKVNSCGNIIYKNKKSVNRRCYHKCWKADCCIALRLYDTFTDYIVKNVFLLEISPTLMVTVQRYAKKNNLQVFCRLFFEYFFEGID